jgi:phosphate transport system permease protein
MSGAMSDDPAPTMLAWAADAMAPDIPQAASAATAKPSSLLRFKLTPFGGFDNPVVRDRQHVPPAGARCCDRVSELLLDGERFVARGHAAVSLARMISTGAPDAPATVRVRVSSRARARLRRNDSIGNAILIGLCGFAAVVVVAAIVLIIWKVIDGAGPAVSKFGISFIGDTDWRPNFDSFGAAVLLFGTAVSSAMALVIAVPIGLAIGLYLSLLAPKGVATIVGPLVQMLAAVPSVILGLWGILVLGPFLRDDIEPALHDALGFIPLFGAPGSSGSSVFTAGLILAIMVVPIIASLSRDLFLAVPREQQDAAAALGATQWEVVRGVVMPSTASGLAAASCLGLGRALGEAIAVTQVIGAGAAIHASLFQTGDTLAARIASQFAGATSNLHKASLFYLALILLVIGVFTNLTAQWIGRRFDPTRGVTR